MFYFIWNNGCSKSAFEKKQKNVGEAKIKSWVGLCVTLLHFMVVCILIVNIVFLLLFSFVLVTLSFLPFLTIH